MAHHRMMAPWQRHIFIRLILAGLFFAGLALACSRSGVSGDASWAVPGAGSTPAGSLRPPFVFPPTRAPGAPILTPTPDSPHKLPNIRTEPEDYEVQPGDTLGKIADAFGVSVEQILQKNKLKDPNVLDVGQKLVIPVPTPEGFSPAFKIIPDSELVYGPMSTQFDLPGYVKAQGGFLSAYREEVENHKYSGIEIVQNIAQDYSVNPLLLLAILEHQSGWISQANPGEKAQKYPLGLIDPQYQGLYLQLSWAANNLNHGYYLWRVNGVATWTLADGRIIPIDPTINAGTAGVQYFFSLGEGIDDWQQAVGENGLFATYTRLFGYPFDMAIEPLVPASLYQPAFQLPFEPGVSWAFTGGPHAGWGAGSAWAALDFAPDTEATGCVISDYWVTAVADGLILRAGDGAVIQDVDNPQGIAADGLEQTGWVVLYMHIDSKDRVQSGTSVKAGDHIGHPSCEGGVSSGTHLHLARRFNGEWIPADQNLPFTLDGWISSGTGKEYDGYLTKNGVEVEAFGGQSAKNRIQR